MPQIHDVDLLIIVYRYQILDVIKLRCKLDLYMHADPRKKKTQPISEIMHADRLMIRLTWPPSPMDAKALRQAASTVRRRRRRVLGRGIVSYVLEACIRAALLHA